LLIVTHLLIITHLLIVTHSGEANEKICDPVCDTRDLRHCSRGSAYGCTGQGRGREHANQEKTQENKSREFQQRGSKVLK
jgi:hypothetical protein